MNVRQGQLFSLLVFCFLSLPSPAQTSYLQQIGPPPTDATVPVELGSIDLTNGNLHLEVPIASFPQRGGQGFEAKMVYDSRIWLGAYWATTPGVWSYRPINVGDGHGNPSMGGWRMVINRDNTASGWGATPINGSCNNELGANSFNRLTAFAWQGPDGAVHTWQSLYTEQDFGTQTCPDAYGDTSAAAGYADDGSGFYLLVTNYQNLTVWSPDGNQVYPIFKDTNGNYFSNDASGNVIDTLGRVPITKTISGNNIFYDVLNAQGTRSRYTVTTESIAVSVPNYSTTLTVVQSITLPNGTNYQFSYDSGGSGDNWGGITSITLPSGGQVTYGYTTYTDAWSYVASTNRWVTSRTSGGGNWHYTPAVIGHTLAVADQQTTVTRPSGDYAIYKFHADCQLGPFKNKEIDDYNAGGALLKQEFIDFSPDFCTQPGSESKPVEVASIPIRITTIINNGNGGSLATKTEYDYTNSPSAGNPTKVSEWSFYTGTAPASPDRVVKSTYSFSLPGYSNLHINNKPLSITLTDGANNQIAQTSYTYDNYTSNQLVSTAMCQTTSASQPPPAAPQHDYQAFCTTNTVRGNLTQVSQWLNATGASITTTTNTFDDTGNIVKTTDALSHATQFTYSPTFGLAYVTQMQNALSHISTKNYDFNTGLLLSEKDPNGRVTGLSTSYTYDNMGRLTGTTLPDGGNITVDFHGDGIPFTVTSTQVATPNPSIAATTTYDGYGRQVKKCVTDPEGDDCAETVYDPNGRVSSVSNPHRTVVAASDGITTFSYDGLDRQISVTQPDQNVVSTSYDIQISPVMGQVVLTTDETLRQRRTVTDGFGRRVEADEPGDSSGGSQSSGALTISGTLQSKVVGAANAAPGTGSVTFTGSERSIQVYNPPPPCEADMSFCPDGTYTTVYDSGIVTITVNGHSNNTAYGSASTATSVASALASAINGDANAFVTAAASNGVLLLTARQTGAGTNYFWSISSSSGDPADFGATASFSSSPASGALSGGVNGSGGTTVYDAGTITVAIGTFQASASYGQTGNNTASAAASALATALNGTNSPVIASATGSSINISYKTVGAAGNIAASCTSSTSQTSYFTSPSFSCPGTTLSGGQDPYSAGLAHPYVARYFYDLFDNLTCVEQHGNTTGAGCNPAVMAITDNQPPAADAGSPWRIRRFAYDSLGRVRWANDPESGLISSQYNDDGNPTSIVDARGVTATLGYDPLHRLTSKSFSDGTNASFVYDVSSVWGVTPTNPIGRLVLESTTDAANLFSYDPVGRPLTTWDCTPKNMADQTGCYNVQTQYDLAGNLKQLIYPSGRKLIYSYNSAGHFTKVNFDSFNGVNVNFPYYNIPPGTGSSNWGYWPTGAMHTGFFGNGVKQTLGINARQQVNAITQATSAQSLLSKNYGLYDASSHNNGDILSIVDVLNSAHNQAYSYDSLNRIGTGSQADGAFSITFNYDPWGNMKQSGTSNFQPLFDIKNRIAVATNCTSATPYCYDAAGNLLNDGFHQYAYDAEGRMKTVDGTTVTYTYDPDGQRVRKDQGSTATEFVYFNGETIAESNPATGAWTDYIFAYGTRIAKDTSANATGAQYFHADQIDSTRLVTDNTGAVIWQATYNPFGQELSTQNTGIRFQFAGMEYDSEDNLNHTEFRQYASAEGRWLSPDPYSGSLDLSNPQSFNRYVYVLNNPIRFNDPEGLQPGCDPESEQCLGIENAGQFSNSIEAKKNDKKLKPCGDVFVDCNGGKLKTKKAETVVVNGRGAEVDYIGSLPGGMSIEPDNRFFNLKRQDCLKAGLAGAAKDFFWPVDLGMHALAWVGTKKQQKDVFGKPVSLFPTPQQADAPWFSTSVGVGTAGMEGLGEEVADSRTVQKGIKGILKKMGVKASNKSIGKAAAKFAKAGPVIHVALSGYAGFTEYRTCMTE
jgi:RHS repeat-associated protein